MTANITEFTVDTLYVYTIVQSLHYRQSSLIQMESFIYASLKIFIVFFCFCISRNKCTECHDNQIFFILPINLSCECSEVRPFWLRTSESILSFECNDTRALVWCTIFQALNLYRLMSVFRSLLHAYIFGTLSICFLFISFFAHCPCIFFKRINLFYYVCFVNYKNKWATHLWNDHFYKNKIYGQVNLLDAVRNWILRWWNYNWLPKMFWCNSVMHIDVEINWLQSSGSHIDFKVQNNAKNRNGLRSLCLRFVKLRLLEIELKYYFNCLNPTTCSGEKELENAIVQ